MYVAGISNAKLREAKVGFWNNVWGFKMSALQKDVLIEPEVAYVDEKTIITNYIQFKVL